MDYMNNDFYESNGMPPLNDSNQTGAQHSADASTDRPVAPAPEGSYHYAGGDGYYGRETVGSAGGYSTYSESSYASQAGQAEAPAPKKHKKQKKGVSAWVPIIVAVALLVGLAGGGVSYKLISDRNTDRSGVQSTDAALSTPSITEPSQQKPAESFSSTVNTNSTDTYLAPSQIYSKYVNAVVGISNQTTTNVFGQVSSTASSGTGFIISEDGYIITNYHVVEGATTLTVTLYDGTEYDATLIGYENTSCDVALLKIDATGLTTVAIGNSDNIQVGEEVCAIGNPLGELTFTLTVGYVSALDREINTDGTPINMFQTDCAINPGNSGGPLFDMNGNVIGITTAKYSGETTSGATIEGLGFAIPINDVMKIVDDLKQYGYVTGQPYMGIRAGDSAYYGRNLPAGAYVGEVTPGSCAEKSGLQVGDVIVGMGDNVIASYTELVSALSEYRAGDTAKLTIYRSGDYLTMNITFDERTPDTGESDEEGSSQAPQQGNGWGYDFP